MNNKIWINNRQPQTLYSAQILLYIRGGFALLFGTLGGIGRFSLFGSVFIATIWLLLVTVGAIGGAFGIANERKWGYRLAIAAAMAPFAIRVAIFLDDGLIDALTFDLFSLIFDIAILAMLLHRMSAEYQRIHFR